MDPLLIEQFQSKGYVQIPMGIFLDRVPPGILDGSAFTSGSKALEQLFQVHIHNRDPWY